MAAKLPPPAKIPDAITGHLLRITHQHFFTSFDDWLTLAVAAFARDEDAYMAVMRRYGPREPGKEHPADHFALALGTWMGGMQQEPADYLGRVYEQQALVNHYAGQFFTPESLTELMAQMTMPYDLADTDFVADPACGSGRMLIAGIRRNRFATFLGTDTALTCVHMTALNCLVRNANTYVIHGNSLSLETWGGYAVRRSPFGGELHRLEKADADRLIRLPFIAPDASTALSPVEMAPAPSPIVLAPEPDVQAVLDDVAANFTVNEKGQGGFGF